MIFQSSCELNLTRPLWRHAGLFPVGSCCFLLDSALESERLGRQSFLGGRPAALLTGKRLRGSHEWPSNWKDEHPGGGQPFRLELITWKNPEGTPLEDPEIVHWDGDPFEALRDLQSRYAGGEVLPPVDGPAFRGGLVGYFGYEAAYCIENLPDLGQDEPQLPDLAFMVADTVLCLDHFSDRVTLTVTGRGADLDTARQDARQEHKCWAELLTRVPATTGEASAGPVSIEGHFNRTTYCQAVQACHEHILAGDVFEVCLTQRLETDFKGNPWDLYCRLRHINPAPFAAWLQFPDFQVVSASPERFLKLSTDRVAESRPIKGTRPRGANPEEDGRLRAELAASEKDRAENLMIVDLVRNDLGRVGEIGSVEVPELLTIEEYATVFQLVSTVSSRLRPGCDALDLVRACYPGGSMTGAPKIEAMKIIDSLEPVKRGIYSGAVGYLDRSGAMELSMVIRTIVCQAGRAWFGVGGAVTADSDPDEEYRETMDKARALIRALGGDPS